MKFCPSCGQPVELRVPAGDNLPRAVCSVCGAIHYENPRVVVGCVPEWQGRILLCRRAIEPRLRLLDHSCGLSRDRRDAAERCGARIARGGARPCGDRLAAERSPTCCTPHRYT